MNSKREFYKTPQAMEPLFPEGDIRLLEHLAVELIERSGRLESCMHSITKKAVAEILRPMNSYYSNLIEGHDTHPIEIAKALKNDYSTDKTKRDLQLEALAHINLHREITEQFNSASAPCPVSEVFIKGIHERFYRHLPTDFRYVYSKEGQIREVIPGAYRTEEVEVGRHIGPYFGSIDSFMDRFVTYYKPSAVVPHAKVRRVISIAASHHRLAWIHPFLDGNGRVVRLFSDACFLSENLNTNGLWSISRGLSRNSSAYKVKLANADLIRFNDYDGRGNLSNKMLIEFCTFFLQTAIDQVNYMLNVLDIDHMLARIHAFTDLMVSRRKLKSEARYILADVFMKGKISKSDAERVSNLSDKTAKIMTDTLEEMGLLRKEKEGIHMMYYVNYSIQLSPLFFPGLYPNDKELEMILSIQ